MSGRFSAFCYRPEPAYIHTDGGGRTQLSFLESMIIGAKHVPDVTFNSNINLSYYTDISQAFNIEVTTDMVFGFTTVLCIQFHVCMF